jgi:hypothetical protein
VVFPVLLLALRAAVSNASTAVAAHEVVAGLAAVGAELVVVVVTCTAGALVVSPGAGRRIIERH